MRLHPLSAPGDGGEDASFGVFGGVRLVKILLRLRQMVLLIMVVKVTIMAVQAVFEIHMERNMEQAMKPSMISAGLVPTKLSIARAILVQILDHFLVV